MVAEAAKPVHTQTEIGVIPKDWEVRKLDGNIDLLTGFPFPSDKYVSHGIRLLRGSNIKRGEIDWSEEITRYWGEVTFQLQNYLLREGDLVIAMDGSLVGRSFARLSKSDVPALLLQRVARIRSDKIVIGYLKEWVCSEYFTKYCDSVKTVTAIPHISPGDIRNFVVPVPPIKEEQSAIASVLSNTSVLIDSLNRFLEKKRCIRQGALQELLTGKRRLPGFREKWEVKSFSKLFKFLNTASNPWADLSEDGDVGYVHYGNIHATTSPFLDCDAVDLPHIGQTRVVSIPFIKNGDLVMADASEDYAGIGKCLEVCHIGGRKIVGGLHTFLLRGNKELLADGFKGYLQFIPSVKASLVRLATGISVYGVSKSNVKRIEVLLPGIKEQTTIARVLAEMDSDIAELEEKRDKYRRIRKGMIQQLLTGSIRLRLR